MRFNLLASVVLFFTFSVQIQAHFNLGKSSTKPQQDLTSQCGPALQALYRLSEDPKPADGTHVPQVPNAPEDEVDTKVEDSRMRRTVRGVGPLTEDVFRTYGIPQEMIPYYSPETGEFHYRPASPLPLARENGDLKLKAIRINWPQKNGAISEKYLRELERALVKQPGLEVWVVVGHGGVPRANSIIDNMPQSARKRIKVVEGGPDNLWSQDASKPLEEGPVTLVPRSMGGNRNFHAYTRPITALEGAGLATRRQTHFRFEGGNVVVGMDHIFVGPDVVQYAVDDLKITRSEAIDALSHEFGKPVVEIGASEPGSGKLRQIDFHIDLTMAVVRNRRTGKETVLLGSVRKAAELLLKNSNSTSTDTPPSDLKTLFTGGSGPTTKAERDLAQLLALKASDLDGLSKREEQLNEVERKLHALGYEVERVPDLNLHPSLGRSSSTPDIFSYTNSIFSGDLALIPEMGVRTWDNYVNQLLKRLGYDTVQLEVAQDSICLEGGVRCLSETYRRPLR